MKVLLAHNFYKSSAPSGEDIVYREERRLLESSGIEVIPFEKHNDDLDDSTFGRRVDIALNTTWSKRSYTEIKILLRKCNPDIAHFHNTFPQISPSAYLACKELGVPVVQTLHNFRFVCAGAMLLRAGHPCEDCLGGSPLPALRHRCYRDSLPATSAVVATILRNQWNGSYRNLVNRYISLTQFARGRFIAGGLPEKRIVVKPNCIAAPSNPPNNKQDYALFVGRLKREKGIKTLLEAWRHLPSRKLLIVGDGELRGDLEAYVSRHSINAQFLGYQPREQVLELVASAAIQIVPSECYEGFPMVVLEAYAGGTPVVATRIGSLTEIIVDGQTGFTFEAGNPNDLLDKVNTLLESQLLLERMSRQALELVRARYNLEHSRSQLLDIYRQACDDLVQVVQ